MKNQLVLSVVVIFVLGFGINLLAQEVTDEQANTEAISKTQELLRNPELRRSALDTPEAKKADQVANITAMGNSQNTNEIYNISADLMPWLVDMTNGDPKLMLKLVEDSKSNPKAIQDFFDKMPSAQREKIKSLARSIESQRGSSQKNP